MFTLLTNNDQIQYLNNIEFISGKPFPAMFHNWQWWETISSWNNFTVSPNIWLSVSLFWLDFSWLVYTDSQYRSASWISNSNIWGSWIPLTPLSRWLRVWTTNNIPWGTIQSYTHTNQKLIHREILLPNSLKNTNQFMVVNHKFYETCWTVNVLSTRFRHNWISIAVSIKSVNPNTQTITTHWSCVINIASRDTSFPTWSTAITYSSNISSQIQITTDFIEWNYLFIEYEYTTTSITIENTTTSWSPYSIYFSFWQTFTDVNQFYNQIIV